MNIYFVCSPDRKVFAYGQTKRSYSQRHRDVDWNKLRTYLRSRNEDVTLLAWYEDIDIVDHDIHRFLKTVPGIPFPSRGEWSSYDKKIYTLESIRDLVEKDRIFLENIHTIKGKEFHNVVLDLTLTRDEEDFAKRRMKFVACSRASETLWTIKSRNGYTL